MSWLSSLTGIHISPQHGFSVEPAKLLTDAMAATGNPAAIAGMIGNGIHAVSPNSGLGKIGNTVGTFAPMAAGMTGGLSGLSSLPGMSTATSALSKIPGASSIGSLGSKALGVLGLGGGAASGAAGGGGWDDPTGGVLEGAGVGSAAGTAASGSAGGLLGWLERNPALASAGASLIGNTVSGIGQGQIAGANMKEQQREFNQNYGLNANSQALQTNRAAQASPLRDQAQYLLQARLGLTPQAFQPHDLFNPSTSQATPQMGGVNLGQYAQKAGQYRPGMGGQSPALQQSILQKLGYGGGVG